MADHSSISSQSPTAVVAAAKDVLPAQEPLQNELNKQPLHHTFIQCKLSIGSPDDPLEHEADAMADTIMRMPEENFIQRKCSHCEEEDKLHRKPLAPFIQRESSSGANASDSLSNQINASRGNGSGMDSNTQSFMQSRFGTDFNDVKIHTGGDSVRMNRELSAKAFTVGNDIYFNEGQYRPHSNDGRHLLAHELTHTVQQGASQSLQLKKNYQHTAFIQRFVNDDADFLTPVADKKVLEKNNAAWTLYELDSIRPLREINPVDNPHTYSNRTYRAQQLIRKDRLAINGKQMGVDGILGGESIIYFHFIATTESKRDLRYKLSGLGFDMETLASDKAGAMSRQGWLNLYKLTFLSEWNVTGPGLPALEHMASDKDESSKTWFDAVIFGGAPPAKIIEDGFDLGQRFKLMKEIYAQSTFKGRAAIVKTNRNFLDQKADTTAMVKRDPGKTSDDPLRISFRMTSEARAKAFEEWSGLTYPDKKTQQHRAGIGLHTTNDITQLTGVLVSFYIPQITEAERARIDSIRDKYISNWSRKREEYVDIKTQAVIAILTDKDSSWYILPHKLEDELNSFWGQPLLFEKMAEKLEKHPDKNYFRLMLARAKEWHYIPTLQALMQLCNQTRYKDNSDVKETLTFLNDMKHYVQSHDYVTGTTEQQGVWINKERGTNDFLKVGDVTTGMYRITETKERIKETKRAQLEARMKELIEIHTREALDETKTNIKPDMTEQQFLESILEQAAQDVKISKDDIEEVKYEEAFRLKGVQSKMVHGVEEFFVEYERVARIGGDGNKWEVTQPSSGPENRYDFEEALGWYKFSNTMKTLETIVTIEAGVIVVVGGVIFLAAGGGAALVALGGGAKMVSISIGISVLIYAITNRHDLSVEGFLKAALEGYLMAVGFRLFAPVGASVAKFIGTATFRRKLIGLLVQSVITGGGSGAFTGAGSLLALDILAGKLHSPVDYLKAASFGFLMGAMFELGGSLLIGPIFKAAGKNVLQRITNIELLKEFFTKNSIVLKPGQWGHEITNSYSGFVTWMRENLEGKLLSELAKDAKTKASSMLTSFVEGFELTVHRQALDLIEAGMTKESVQALETLIASSRSKLGTTGSRALVDDVLNQLAKDTSRVNPFFSMLKAADADLMAHLMQGTNMKGLAAADNILRISLDRSPIQMVDLLKNHFNTDVLEFDLWSKALLGHKKDIQTQILNLLESHGGSVTPKSLLRVAESGTAFSPEVVDGLTRMISETRMSGRTPLDIETTLKQLADDKVEAFMVAMGKLPKNEFGELLVLTAKPEQAARLLNYVDDVAQMVRILDLARKNADALDVLFTATAGKGKFPAELEYLLGQPRANTASVTNFVKQFHGDALLAKNVLDKISPHVEKRIFDKMVESMSNAGHEGIKLAEKLGLGNFDVVEGYFDLVKKASIDTQSIKAVNQALDKAEVLSQRGVNKNELRFEDDLGTGVHDVDLGIKDLAVSGGYKEAYQFKTLDGKLTPKKIQEAATQLKKVTSPKKILEFKCDPSTTAADISSDAMIKEMKFQSGILIPGKGNGITEFHFILSDGTIIIKNVSNLL